MIIEIHIEKKKVKSKSLNCIYAIFISEIRQSTEITITVNLILPSLVKTNLFLLETDRMCYFIYNIQAIERNNESKEEKSF